MGATESGRWVDAQDLLAGDELLLRGGGRVRVAAVRLEQRSCPVYNFAVDAHQNYAVGRGGWLVHNSHSTSPTTYGDIEYPGFSPSPLSRDSHGRQTNGVYSILNEGMSRHTGGSLSTGRSQFLYNVDANRLVLQAAELANTLQIWSKRGKAKIVFDRPIGVHYESGRLTNVLNVYRKQKTKREVNLVHGSPGSPQ